MALLEARLGAAEYDAVRATMSAVEAGAFAGGCPAGWGPKPLVRIALEAAARCGATPETLRAAGYPEEVRAGLPLLRAVRASRQCTSVQFFLSFLFYFRWCASCGSISLTS
jgi:hypothetical protein